MVCDLNESEVNTTYPGCLDVFREVSKYAGEQCPETVLYRSRPQILHTSTRRTITNNIHPEVEHIPGPHSYIMMIHCANIEKRVTRTLIHLRATIEVHIPTKTSLPIVVTLHKGQPAPDLVTKTSVIHEGSPDPMRRKGHVPGSATLTDQPSSG
ncbi:uncharacterized protein H6S33_011075 [Morchella sextelata]|uniref:uncharacterized protein n=1 Tax=Morchella sextelata TaxID=1174677 RepID=UPI001D05836D|nr:uncharacterized protein H6S33_011075 [Morchella sextelata]KAH0611810.1 hypothetical protein H6S33_011075 [Morchella sextelata]